MSPWPGVTTSETHCDGLDRVDARVQESINHGVIGGCRGEEYEKLEGLLTRGPWCKRSRSVTNLTQ